MGWLKKVRTHQNYVFRVSTSEASGPAGAGSNTERNAKVKRPESGIKLQVPRK